MINLSSFNALLGALLLTGFVGSFGHCLGMCGPLLVLAGARFPKQGVASTPYHVIYHIGRILVYTLLGFIFGALGGAMEKLAAVAKIPGIVSLVIGVIVVILGLSYLGWLPFLKRSIEPNGWWQRVIKKTMQTTGWIGAFTLGLLNGILPCGLVYQSLFIAGGTGSPWIGALGMFLFGMATLPALVIFGVGAQLISTSVRKWLFWIGGVFVIIIGVLLILRGIKGMGLVDAGKPMGMMK